jgi:hypothetical protein
MTEKLQWGNGDGACLPETDLRMTNQIQATGDSTNQETPLKIRRFRTNREAELSKAHQ